MIRFPLLRVAEALVVDDIRRHELVGSEPRSLKARSAGDRFGMTHQTDPQPLALPGEVDSDIDDQELGALGHGLDEGDKLTALNEQIEAVVAKGAIIIGGDGPRRPRRDADPLRIGGKRQRPNLAQ